LLQVHELLNLILDKSSQLNILVHVGLIYLRSVHVIHLLVFNQLHVSVLVLVHSLVLKDINLLKQLVIIGADGVVTRRIVLNTRVFFAVNIIISDNGLDFACGILEVGLGTQSLRDNGDVIVVSSSIKFVLDCSDIDLLLINHNHHL
jgi:hypothetical protein